MATIGSLNLALTATSVGMVSGFKSVNVSYMHGKPEGYPREC